ncbi:MAG TPA: NAD+ synthase [Accumulibacter sp.]|uniref:Glutamine-dependent NAD(+) synthetase n=1 Tax=Candidatus Accumulibacter cognatus TaxID=2954383 RepID=A0A080M5M6_9PROT|nr:MULTISPECIES: NAD+ synthase [Candidatus Accumulibacter]KFB76316.1 MAG: Glutamine-dependent NAD(+) synthetase [Candidatus Accumulibacter cognatus]HNC20435.1 NAD+ synthase [Accumulibacter sp.]HNF92065.1 NAD+ synthase [Accumulibacter sp.]
MSLKIAIAQINVTVGDFAGNRARILDFAERARRQGADLLLTPELALCGYPPEDLLLRDDFCATCDRELATLAASLPGIAVLVGHPEKRGLRCYNAATLINDGRRVATYYKQRLPSYEVFDEERYFESGDDPCVLTIKGVRCGVNICADVWEAGAADLARQAGAEVLLVLNASPYHIGKRERRTEVLRQRTASTGLPVVYANLAGGQDELVFDGGSFVLDSQGALCCQWAQFEETLGIVDFVDGQPQPGTIVPAPCLEAEVYQALLLGVRDYLGKNCFPGAIIGLSGGIDSALTLCIAVDALGADKVRAVMMPSPYTAEISLSDSREMVRLLGVRYDEIAIEPAMQTLGSMLDKQFAGLPTDTTEENLQARIRGMILMAISNKTGSLVLTTGNKSEMAVGYCTLYGDMAGGFAVIKDIAKTLVYRLARWRNTVAYAIPERIINRPPSAELKPDQTDQDSLPPYEVLDAIVEAYMEKDLSPREIIARGHAEADVRRVVHLLKISEYKRRQSPVGIRVTQRGFGKDWRYPITNRYRDLY